MRRFIACCVLFTLAAQAAQAGLIDRLHKGKTEEQIAKDFDGTIQTFLETLCKDKNGFRPEVTLEIKKQQVFCRLESIKGDTCTFAKLVRWEWFGPPVARYSYMPFEPKYTVKVADIPVRDIAAMFDSNTQPAEVSVSLACWLVAKKELWLANNELSVMLAKRADLKEDVENWLCEKHGWTRPEKGLAYVHTLDIEQYVAGLLAVTPEADAARLAELDKAAQAMAKKIEEQRGDFKGAIGARKKLPTARLDTLIMRIDLFERAYAGTAYVLNKKNMEKLKDLSAGMEADLAEIKTKAFAAERDGMDDKWLDSAKKYAVLLTADPRNERLQSLTADAYLKAGNAFNAGRECKDPESMKKAAELYARLAEDFPLIWSYHACAGAAYRTTGDTKKARAYFEFVWKNAPDGDANRQYAKNQLSSMKE
ncbi:MAG: hypothetical protein IT462_01805 [Planctomycetes bacterium]|nr:hypothetical protein [Planctomycetota bacterium]